MKKAFQKVRRVLARKHVVDVSFKEALLGCTKVVETSHRKMCKVMIPPGTRDREVIEVDGRLFRIFVDESLFYDRVDEYDLLATAPIDCDLAMKGGAVQFKTPWGEVLLKIPSMIKNGQILRIRGHGVRAGDEDTGQKIGDLLLKVKVVG